MRNQGPYPLRSRPYYETAGGWEGVVQERASGVVRCHPGRANVFDLTLVGNVTSFTLAPLSQSPGAVSVTVIVRQDAVGSRTVTWASSIDWGTTGAPTLTTTANKADVVTFFTIDGGRKWAGFLSAKGFGI
jgi:hypothetical protein